MRKSTLGSPLRVFLVEDNPADVMLMTDTAAADQLDLFIHRVASDGDEGLAWVRSASANRESLPDLLVIDISLPRRSGLEVLAELKTSAIRHIPAIVWSSSSAKADARKAYDLGAAGYFCKPSSLEELRHILQVIQSYWGTALSKGMA